MPAPDARHLVARRRARPPVRARGLSWPALVFASVLATGGIPASVLTSPAATGYITGQQDGAAGGDQNLVRTAYASLERLGLLSLDNASAVRTVWLHSAVRPPGPRLPGAGTSSRW